MTTLETNWVVLRVTQRSSRYGNEIYEITFANANNEIAHTYVDEDNMNFSRWADIIRAMDQDLGVVVNGLKIKQLGTHKKTGEPLINADSKVRVVHCEDNFQDLLDQFAQVLEGTE